MTFVIGIELNLHRCLSLNITLVFLSDGEKKFLFAYVYMQFSINLSDIHYF